MKWTEQGEVIRFAYRVLDGNKAQALNDKKAEPQLIDPQAGVKLVVPALENVGLLRQTPSGKPEPGKIYWMAFSNKGRLVKRGDHVNVVIGRFRADGLIVDYRPVLASPRNLTKIKQRAALRTYPIS